jgi:charged multivesicular body protein 7
VTWDLNPFNPNRFSHLPRTESDAKSAGWEKIGDGCEGSESFLGQRYRDPKDFREAAILLFSNGRVVGIQTRMPLKNLMTPVGAMAKEGVMPAAKAFTTEGDSRVLTVYFTEPSKICTGDVGIEKGKTASNVYIQYGENPAKDYIAVPREQSKLDTTVWGRGKCMPTMGQHYWYDITDDMDCDGMFPYCLLYNGGKLDGFCFATPANELDDAKHYEHPSTSAASKCCMETPKCFHQSPMKDQPQTTMHVFLTSNPYTGMC